jgi:hypothetical protein
METSTTYDEGSRNSETVRPTIPALAHDASDNGGTNQHFLDYRDVDGDDADALAQTIVDYHDGLEQLSGADREQAEIAHQLHLLLLDPGSIN